MNVFFFFFGGGGMKILRIFFGVITKLGAAKIYIPDIWGGGVNTRFGSKPTYEEK